MSSPSESGWPTTQPEPASTPASPPVRETPEQLRKRQERAEAEAEPAARLGSLIARAVFLPQFDLLGSLIDDVGKDLQARYPSAPASDAWTAMISDFERRRRLCVTNETKARNEDSCIGCRGRLSAYEAAVHICSKCQRKADEFDKLMK